MKKNDKKDIHIIGSEILDIFDSYDEFRISTEDIKKDFTILTDYLSKNSIDYNKLRKVLNPTSRIYSFVFNCDFVEDQMNYIATYITKIANCLEKNMSCIFLSGDLIVNKNNNSVYSKIFSEHCFDVDYINKFNIFIIDVINLTPYYFSKITNELKQDKSFLFSMDITTPSIEKLAMTYMLPQNCIKFKNKIIYSVLEETDKSNYSLIDNEDNKYRLVPVLEYYYFSFLSAKPLQISARMSELNNSVRAFFDINIKEYPKVSITEEKYKYALDHANISIEKDKLCDLCFKSITKNQIYHLNKNDYSKAPELIFNITIMIDDKEYLCSLGWNFDNNEARVITVHYNKL